MAIADAILTEDTQSLLRSRSNATEKPSGATADDKAACNATIKLLKEDKTAEDEASDLTIDATENRKCVWPIPQATSLWLAFSSCFFLAPASYAYHMQFFHMGVLSTFTSLISMAYWVYAAEDSWRRLLDRMMAKFSFIVYFCHGVWHVLILQRHVTALWLVGIPLLCGILYGYFMSGERWKQDGGDWFLYHMLFHLCVACEQGVVLYAMSLTGLGTTLQAEP
eukprot:TRINITY_DN38211_c0_g1_i1.p1 TRINITY_DN38211_c0_g1~~TRINITY_DN38211_c0_g1_i1.p1  ORF type:complete len:223 (-),score=29.62 TRINITY_DN38211_c0_g1_i1:101-769(-)